MIESHDPEEQLREQSYFLKCKVLVKEVAYQDEQSKGVEGRTEEMIFLVPEYTTQMSMFFGAWLPDYEPNGEEKHHEVTIKMGHPVFGHFRAAVMRRNKNCDKHHIFVMSRGAEEDLKMMRDKQVEVEVLPQSSEDLADTMKDFSLTDNRASEIVKI